MSASEPHGGRVAPDSPGGSPQTAIPVSDVGEEYAWLARNLPGALPHGQTLMIVAGRPLDVLTVFLGTGEELQLYFDISSFYDPA